MIRISNLTANQSDALGQVVPRYRSGLVLKTSRSNATLNGTAQECLTVIQDILNAIREEKGADSPEYRTIGSIRNRVHDFVTTGKTSYVNVVPTNGVNMNGDVPPILSGTRVSQDAAADDVLPPPAPPKAKGRPRVQRAAGYTARVGKGSQVAREAPARARVGQRTLNDSQPVSEAPAAAQPTPATPEPTLEEAANGLLDVLRPTLPQPEITPACIENFRYMLKNAPSLWAENYWEGKLDDLSADALTT